MPNVAPSAIALFSMFLYNCINAMFAYLTNVMKMSMLQLIMIQATPSLVVCSIYVYVSGTPGGLLGPPGTRAALWGTALFGVLSTLPLLFSFKQLTLSENVTVNCLLPFVTAFMGWVWLGERFTRTQCICCLTCVIGVVMVADPLRLRVPASSHHGREDGIPDSLSVKVLGIGVVLLGIFLQAPQYILIRHIGDRASTMQMMTITYLSLTISALLLMLVTREPFVIPSKALGWSLLGAMVALWIIADRSTTYAGQRISPTTLTICGYPGVVFSSCIQWAIYGNHPSLVALAGMVIVMTAGLYGVIYGPAVSCEADGSSPIDAEDARLLLPADQESNTDYGAVSDRDA